MTQERGEVPTSKELTDELAAMVEQLHALIDSWKERCNHAENRYRYWRNRAERCEDRLGVVPSIPDEDLVDKKLVE